MADPPRRAIAIDGYWLLAALVLGVDGLVLTPFFPRLQPAIFAAFVGLWLLQLKRLELSSRRIILPGLGLFAAATFQSLALDWGWRAAALILWGASGAASILFTWRIGRLKPAVDPSVFSGGDG